MHKTSDQDKDRKSKRRQKLLQNEAVERRTGRDRRQGFDRRGGFDRRRDQDHGTIERSNITKD